MKTVKGFRVFRFSRKATERAAQEIIRQALEWVLALDEDEVGGR